MNKSVCTFLFFSENTHIHRHSSKNNHHAALVGVKDKKCSIKLWSLKIDFDELE